MHSSFLRVALSGGALLIGATAFAQSGDTGPRRSPLDAAADVPPVVYRSPFASARAGAQDKPRSWRELNDNVERIGGWREYLREAQQPETKPETKPETQGATPARPGKPAAAEHAGGGHKH